MDSSAPGALNGSGTLAASRPGTLGASGRRPVMDWIGLEAVVVLIGCVVLLGWLLDVTAFKSIVPSFPSMKPNAAIATILSGVSLWLLRHGPQDPRRRWLAHACALGVVLIGSLTLAEYLFGWELGVDQLLFREASGALGTSSPGRMGANATVILIFDGLALLLLDVERRGIRPAQVLALTSGTLALVALSGYLTGAYVLTAFGSATRISLYAAIAYLAISVGVLLARPDAGLMRLVTSRGVGGLALRRLLVPAIAIPLLLGWLLHLGEHTAIYEAEQTLALLVAAVIVFFVSVTWLTARLLDRADAQRRRAEEGVRALTVELEGRVRELDATNAELEAFSYSVSHDLRAPLRAIDGFSRLLLEEYSGDLPSEAQRYLGIVDKGAQDMAALIDGLLAFSKLGQQPLSKRSVSVESLAREVVAELELQCDGRQVDISIGPLPPVRADPALLRQVLVNLVSNALKYTQQREAATIELGSEGRDGSPAYFVRDNGVGFDMQYADKLFEVFQRLHRAEEYEGTGVGLALVARIVDRHGGHVWAEAAPDRGATFYFTLNGEPT